MSVCKLRDVKFPAVINRTQNRPTNSFSAKRYIFGDNLALFDNNFATKHQPDIKNGF